MRHVYEQLKGLIGFYGAKLTEPQIEFYAESISRFSSKAIEEGVRNIKSNLSKFPSPAQLISSCDDASHLDRRYSYQGHEKVAMNEELKTECMYYLNKIFNFTPRSEEKSKFMKEWHASMHNAYPKLGFDKFKIDWLTYE